MLKSSQHWKCIVCVCLVYLTVSFLFFNALKLGFLFCHFARMISLAVLVTCMCKIEWTLTLWCLSHCISLWTWCCWPSASNATAPLLFQDTALVLIVLWPSCLSLLCNRQFLKCWCSPGLLWTHWLSLCFPLSELCFQGFSYYPFSQCGVMNYARILES